LGGTLLEEYIINLIYSLVLMGTNIEVEWVWHKHKFKRL